MRLPGTFSIIVLTLIATPACAPASSTARTNLDATDGVMWDISPNTLGNAPLAEAHEYEAYYDFFEGGDWGAGYDVNPVTGEMSANIAPSLRLVADFVYGYCLLAWLEPEYFDRGLGMGTQDQANGDCRSRHRHGYSCGREE